MIALAQFEYTMYGLRFMARIRPGRLGTVSLSKEM